VNADAGGHAVPPQGRVQQRDEQPYAAIRRRVTMATFPDAVHDAWPTLRGWLDAHGMPPTGAPFIRYLTIDMERELEVEFALPVASTAPDDDPVRFGTLPAGGYATWLHTGPYDGLVASNAAALAWAAEEGLALEGRATDRGDEFRARVEHYLTDPAAEPDPARWEVEIAFLLAER
jgi:effector-binding domain-containing protein